MEDKYISAAVINRLPRYYRYLGDMITQGIERVSSYELSERMRVTASQIRQDFNNFGGFGQQGYGYNVKYLHDEIGKILGLNVKHNLIIIGAGNIGKAIANYQGFEARGFHFLCFFDCNPDLCNTKAVGLDVHPMEELPEYLRNSNVDIAVLTVPRAAAQKTAEIVIENGVKGIWNFAHYDLKVPADVKVQNVHLSDSIMRLSYELKNTHN